MIIRPLILAGVALAISAAPSQAAGYKLINLVANKQIYEPQLIDERMLNAWGLAIRPAGAGGHFWINNTDSGTNSMYIGDVNGVALHQDKTPFINIAAPAGQTEPSHPTGDVFNGRDDEFIVTHDGITGPSKFIFATEEGSIVGWTENKKEDGSFIRPVNSITMVDNSKKGAIYKGMAISEGLDHNRLYLADFGNKRIDVFDSAFKPMTLGKEAFAVPAGTIPANYAPFNIQALNGTLYIVYAELSKEPGEETKGAGKGYVAAFDYNGKFIRALEGAGKLDAPWGIAAAPDGFGKHSGHLLVGNFGDGTIVAFDPDSGKQIDYLRRPDGKPIMIDGLWAMLFGNGVHLGEKNHLYFTAGPADEADGVFGKLVAVE
ncbi:MAG: TIGR03118 family protein [Alphaproteobacteria bacterium]|nr:TIGR03118 family protein [Alphaproteobacteria bacterium]